MKVNIHLAEVRQVKVKYTKTKAPEAQEMQDNGKQAAKPAQNQSGQSFLSKIGDFAKGGLDKVKGWFK